MKLGTMDKEERSGNKDKIRNYGQIKKVRK